MWKVIKSKDEYEIASLRLQELIENDLIEGTPELDEYELLCLVIEDYESKNFKFDAPDPIDYIEFIMEQKGLSQKDMAPYFGSPSKVSEVLNRKRNLSLSMIRKLNKGLGIPADLLIKDLNKIDDNDIDESKRTNSANKAVSFTSSIVKKLEMSEISQSIALQVTHAH